MFCIFVIVSYIGIEVFVLLIMLIGVVILDVDSINLINFVLSFIFGGLVMVYNV